MSNRKIDDSKVLTYAPGKRMPSRMGAVEWARDAVNWEGAKGPHVLLAMAIALRIDDTLVCWPRQQLLAADTCLGVATVRRSLRELEAHKIAVALYLWRENETSGCVYALNVDGWLDDVIDSPDDLLKRVVYARNKGFELERNIRSLPKGTTLSARKPSNGK